MSSPEVPRLVDHLFRRHAGRMVATLTGIFGPANLDLAEEVVQDALVRALEQWPYHGVPENPSAWIVQVAKRRALDLLRRRAMHDRHAPEIARALLGSPELSGNAAPAAYAHEFTDDQLRMMFMCCHPLLPADARSALTLNVVAGFSAREVARAFLLEDATAAQRLVRAKKKLRDARARFEMPPPAEAAQRLDAVLEAVYLLFNEGYSAHAGDELVRRELCAEAVRLGRLLAAHPVSGAPRTHALLSLMLFQAARLDARVDAAGELQLLTEQDRTRWDRGLIAGGFHHLALASEGEELTPYHVQAAIASCHAAAGEAGATDWPRILALYDQLLVLQPSPVVRLNRAVALAMVHGPEAGISAVEPLTEEASLRAYPLLPATLAELYRRAGDAARTAEQLRAALSMPATEVERRFLQRRLEEAGRTGGGVTR